MVAAGLFQVKQSILFYQSTAFKGTGVNNRAGNSVSFLHPNVVIAQQLFGGESAAQKRALAEVPTARR